MFLSNNIFLLYLFFEIRLFPIILIILGWGYNQERLLASTLLLLYTLVARLPFLLIISLWKRRVSILLSFFIFFPFLVKLPLRGIHLWLPKAHVESPTIGSIILAGILLKLGRFGVFWMMKRQKRILNLRLFLLLSIVIIFFLTSTQRDGKRLIAYRRVGHINLGIILLLSFFRLRREGFILINYYHIVIRGLMFYIIGVIFYLSRRRIIYLLKRWGSLFFLLIVILVFRSNMGAPPIRSFVREFIHISLIFLKFPLFFIILWIYLLLGGYFSIFFFIRRIYSPLKRVNIRVSSLNKLLFLFLFSLFLNSLLLLLN